jgi:hypothetical protein
MGAIGYAVTGGVFYNDLSSPDGSLALPNEGTTLDSCFGHSDAVSQLKKSLKVSVKAVHIVCVYQTGNRDYCFPFLHNYNNPYNGLFTPTMTFAHLLYVQMPGSACS